MKWKTERTPHMIVEQLRKIPLSIDVLKQVRNWGNICSLTIWVSLARPSVEYQLRNETLFLLRPGTADRTIINEIWSQRLPIVSLLPGTSFIDIVAHHRSFPLLSAFCSLMLGASFLFRAFS